MPRLLKRGDKGRAVKALQLALHRSMGTYATNLRNGAFGSRTFQDVVRFQRAHGLSVDGEVGDQTWAALEPNIVGAARKLLDADEVIVPTNGGGNRAKVVAEANWALRNAASTGRWPPACARRGPRPDGLLVVRYALLQGGRRTGPERDRLQRRRLDGHAGAARPAGAGPEAG